MIGYFSNWWRNCSWIVFFSPFFSPRSMISFSVSRCIFRFICLLPVGFDERKKNVPPVGTSDVVNFKENEIIHARCISIKRSSISDKEFCRSLFFFFLFKKSNWKKQSRQSKPRRFISRYPSFPSIFDAWIDRGRTEEEREREKARERRGGCQAGCDGRYEGWNMLSDRQRERRGWLMNASPKEQNNK